MPHGSSREVIGLYQRHGAAWAALRGSRLMERSWFERFCALLPERGSVLDIGCGSGLPLGAALRERGFAVTGVDGSSAMLELFAFNLPECPFHLMDMRSLSLGKKFGGILAWDSFFHLSQEDQRGMFPLFAGHAKPGAALMFTSGPVAGEALGELEGETLYHASLDPDEYTRLLDSHGFEVVHHIAQDPQCGQHTVWLARKRQRVAPGGI